MIIIKCARCKTKLFKYQKIGSGSVLRCHKSRIKRVYQLENKASMYCCICGNSIGKDEGAYIKMNGSEFTYSGTKE